MSTKDMSPVACMGCDNNVDGFCPADCLCPDTDRLVLALRADNVRLRREMEGLQAERDTLRRRAEALHEDLKRYPTCNTCKHYKQIERGRWLFSSPDCECCMDDDDRPAWEWRGHDDLT